MIVDDEPVSQEYIRSLISWKEAGFLLHPPVHSAEEARNLLESSPADIVLLDVFMPGEDGAALSRHIAENYPGTAMLAVSSHDDYDYVREIFRNGAHDYILKHRLNGEVLRHALDGITAKLNGKAGSAPLPPEEKDIREKIRRWLFSGGLCPFPQGQGRLAFTVARLPMESTLPEQAQNIIIPGVISLIENIMKEEGEIKTLFQGPDFFITCVRFFNMISERKILDFLSRLNQKSHNNIRLIYNMEYLFWEPPLMVIPAGVPGQIRRIMESFSTTTTAGMGITLSLTRKKILIITLTERNQAGAELLLHEIFSSIEDQGTLLSVARDVSDLLISFMEEKRLHFPLDSRLVLEWLKEKKPAEVEEKFNQLFRQIINLTKENQEFSVHIRQARNYILTHYASDINLEKTAAELYISPAYLSRLYKKETGISFVDDLNRVRVDAARICLLDGINLKKTATLCGFKYYNYFIKVFKDYTGLTPADFLRRNSNVKTASDDKIL